MKAKQIVGSMTNSELDSLSACIGMAVWANNQTGVVGNNKTFLKARACLKKFKKARHS